MSWLENSLTQLETSLRAFIEGDSTYDGIGRKFHNQLVHALVLAMQGGMNKVPSEVDPGVFVYSAPDQYTLVMPAEQAKLLLNHPAELDRLSTTLIRTAERANIQLASAPILRVVASPNADEVSVLVAWSHAKMDDSGTTELEEVPYLTKTAGIGKLPGAFLIVNGLTTFPIASVVTNIGRGTGNQLILDLPGVSSQHAQLRLINNHHTIFDLYSRGRTLVNGTPVASQVLNPGDVIELGGVPLVYGLETPNQAMGYTQELEPDNPKPEVL